MNKEEIIKQLDKQNIELSEELSITKDKLNKSEYLLKLKQQELERYKNIVEEIQTELFDIKDMIYKPETREENTPIQRKISEVIKKLEKLKG